MHTSILPLGNRLSLANTGALELFWIGVGNASTKRNGHSNFLIIKGDTHIMVDLGALGPGALLKTANLTPLDIKCVLPTHSHADHVGGFEELALEHRYASVKKGGDKPVCIINEYYQEILWDRTLRGGLEWNEENGKGQLLTFTDYFSIFRPVWKTQQPREIWRLNYGGIELEMFRTKHVPDNATNWQSSFVCYGLMIDGRVLVSGDTRFDSELLDIYGDKAECIFHDVQFFPGAVHAPIANLKSLPSNWKEKMFLYHYADTFEGQDVSGFAGWTKQGLRYIF